RVQIYDVLDGHRLLEHCWLGLPSPILSFFNALPPNDVYTLSLHDALPISQVRVLRRLRRLHLQRARAPDARARLPRPPLDARGLDRKSTRLNSSHVSISYAVFCLKKLMNWFSSLISRLTNDFRNVRASLRL